MLQPVSDSPPLQYFFLNYYLSALPPVCLASSDGRFSSAFTHQSLIQAHVLAFSNKAHLKNLDANYFALFMPPPSPCRFKHFRGHLDSSNYLGYSQLRHE